MIYAIGDIHGHRSELERALATIAQDRDGAGGARVVFLGDYVDRGPDSRGVLDRLVSGIAAGEDWVCLRGNHDAMLLDFVTEPALGPGEPAHWLSDGIGGRATVRSYGVDADPRRDDADIQSDLTAAMPAAHRDFLTGLAFCHETADHFFCHAGIRPGVPFAEQTGKDLIWIREPFLSATRDHGKLVVHGHTPLAAPCHYGNRLNLDGGAGYGRPLWPVLLVGRRAFALERGKRTPL